MEKHHFFSILVAVCLVGVLALASGLVVSAQGEETPTVELPTEEPTEEPMPEPTEEPKEEPTVEPTEEPTSEPTEEPTEEPTVEPTGEPTEEPAVEPTEEPAVEPTEEPVVEPTEAPTPIEAEPAPIIVGEVETTDLEIDYLSEQSWTQTIRYPNAAYIKVHFLKLDLLPGDYVTVSDPAGIEVYTYPKVSDYTTDEGEGFWAMSVTGDTAVIELHSEYKDEALADAASHQLGGVIDKYARGYPPEVIRELIDLAESQCGGLDRRDAICYQTSHPTEWGKSSAVAGMLLNNGTGWCTGWRVTSNNHMFTNEHCISSQSDVQAAEAWFNYYRTTCGGSTDATVTKVSGNSLETDDYTLDFALFTVNNFSSISGFGYLELDVRTPVLDEEIYIPQHGGWQGRRQFGIEDDMNTGNVCRIDDAIMNGRGIDTDTGYYCDTISGSSGSPVLARSSHKVIGLHHFGGCLNSGVRIDLIWPLVSSYLVGTPPGAATLVSPSGTISDNTPTYTWDAVSDSTWYYLWVNGPSGTVINQWYTAASVCSGGTCSVTPSTVLANGAHIWWIQTWNSYGYGPWSDGMSFTVSCTLPAAATLVSPSGTISDNTPTYTWNEVSEATWYYLWVNGPSGPVIQQWYTAASVCSGGTCSVTPSTTLANGAHTWWIETWNSCGYGPWSSGMSFTVSCPPPGAPTLVSPSGTISDDTPTYTWNEVSEATWYYLWVNGPSGTVINQWYTAASVCSGGTCSVTPSTVLDDGDHTWWVLAWSSCGYGPWSAGMDFTVSPEGFDWTFLVYLAGDNNLEGAGIDDFLEMSSVGSNSDVNIVVQFDRIPGHDSSYGDWTDTRRFYVTLAMEPWDYNGVSIGEVNMGDPQTLTDFVQWGMTNYPADRYAVIIWDHGSGWRLRPEDQPLLKDVAFDDTSGGDGLDMPELRSVMDTLSNGGADPLDLVGFDACLMAMIEVDNQLIPYVDVRVGSEETEPWDGWPYDTILSALVGNPTMSASQLGTVIVDEYYASYGNSQTQSAVDLHSPYDTLNTAVNDFAVALISGVGSHYAGIASARSSTQEFYTPSYIDLYDFAYQVNQHVSDATINAAATDVMNAVNNAVIHEHHGSSWPGAHGISIYFPESEAAYDSTYDGSQGWLQFTVNTQWDEWLHAFYDNVVCSDPHEPNDAPGQATSISYDTTLSDPDICPAGDVDYYAFTGSAGDTIVADIDAWTIGSALDSYLYLYDTDGVTVLTYNDDDDGLDSRITYVLPADGTYYLMVRDYWNDGGPAYFYTISLSLESPTFDVDANWTSSTPTMDGQISSGEWTDAATYDITESRSLRGQKQKGPSDITLPESLLEEQGRWQMSFVPENQRAAVTLYAMNDGTHLYLAIDNPNDTTVDDYDQMGVYFDDNPLPSDGQWTNTSCGNPDGEGNFWVLMDMVQYREWIAGPDTCPVVVPAPGTSGAVGYDSGHAQAEIAIDLTSSALRATAGDAINMYLWIYDYNTGVQNGIWPSTAIYYDPATYGRLTLSVSPGGFNSQFNGSAPGWEVHSGTWWIDSDAWYTTQGLSTMWSSVSYAADYTNFDYEARLRRNGCDSCANSLLIRGTPNPLSSDYSWYSYYAFQYTRDGSYSVWKRIAGSSTSLQGWTFSSAINQGSAWNTLRVVADGSALYYYINGTLVWSGSDASLSSGRVGIRMYSDGTSGDQLWADWATLSTSEDALTITDTVSAEQQALNEAANERGGGSEDIAPAGQAGDASLPDFAPSAP